MEKHFFLIMIMNFIITTTISPDYVDLKVLEEDGSQLLHN